MSSRYHIPWRRAGARRVAEEVVQGAAALRREASQQRQPAAPDVATGPRGRRLLAGSAQESKLVYV